MKISIEQLFPLLVEQQFADSKESQFKLEIGESLFVNVISGSQRIWLVTELGKWDDCDNNQEVSDSLSQLLHAVMANAASYEDSIALSEQDCLLLQRSLSVDDLTEDRLIETFNAHSAYACYLHPLLERKETISWKHHGIIHP